MNLQDHTQNHKVPWIAIVFIILALFTFLKLSGDTRYGMMPVDYNGVGGDGAVAPSAGMMENNAKVDAGISYSPPYQQNEVPVTDTREFMKIDYNVQMNTRDVQSLTRRAETVVRGYDGRVDSISSSDKYGYIGFVVPATKFEQFRSEIEGLVGEKFLTVNIQSQNLLPQKVSIEEQRVLLEKNLADLRDKSSSLTSTHKTLVNSLQVQINTNDTELASLRSEVTNDPTRRSQISNRIYVLTNDQTSLRSRLSSENSSYTRTLASYDNQINYYTRALSGNTKQDQNLLESVETVRGTIAINWVSLWEIAQLYLPGYWIPFLLLIAGGVAYFFERRRAV